MLGGDKRFNDLLCWALMLPLAALAFWAVGLACMALELAIEGGEPGGAAGAVGPLRSLLGGYAAVLVGAKVAPDRKPGAATALAVLYSACTAAWAWLGWTRGSGAAWSLAVAAAGAAGAAWAVLAARKLPPDEDAPAKTAQPGGGK